MAIEKEYKDRYRDSMENQIREMYDINKLCGLCLQMANLIDVHGECNDHEYIYAEMGLGYRVLSTYLRDGVKSVIDLQSKVSQMTLDLDLLCIRQEESEDDDSEDLEDSESVEYEIEYESDDSLI
jgi:hypothetical protein